MRSQEVEYWWEMHRKRPYCNFTYMYEDATLLTESTQHAVVDLANRSMHSASDYLAPYTTPVQKAYDTYLKKHVHSAAAVVEPHVTPVMKRAREVTEQSQQEVMATSQRALGAIVDQLAQNCPAEALSPEGLQSAGFQRRNVDRVCRDPQATVVFSLKVVAYLVLFACRRLLWRMMVGTVRTILWILFYPGRLLIRAVRPVPKANVKMEGQ